MMILEGMLADVSRAATGSLVAAVWQGVLLAVVVRLGLRLLPKTPAAVRFAIWFGVFLVVTALPVISLWPRTAVVAAAGHGPWLMLDPRWSLTVAAVWLLASAWRAGQLVVAAVRVRGLWKRATPVEVASPTHDDEAVMNGAHSVRGLWKRATPVEVASPTHDDEAVMNGAHSVRGLWKRATPVEVGCPTHDDEAVMNGAHSVRGLWKRARPVEVAYPTHDDETVMNGAPGFLAHERMRRVELCTSDEVDRPTVIGFFAPKILIPGWLLEKLTAAELEQVVLHESGHLGRADDWMNLLQKIALVVFPLNPALAWVERRLCFERELACDERVLRETGAPKAYASCLATLAEYRLGRRGLALAIGILGRESELGQRVGRILRRGAQMKPWHAKLVLGGALLGLVVAATGLERCPQLVGFSDAGSQTVARRQQGLPTHGDETAMNGAPIVRVQQGQPTQGDETAMNGAPGFGARPVMFRMGAGQGQDWKTVGDADAHIQKPHTNSGMQQNVEAKREVAPSALHALDVVKKTPGDSADRAARLERASAEDQTQGGDVVVTQWTMVTQFHDGSRMVLTTAQVSSSAPRIEQDSDTPATAQQDVHPYAAVPVRGGWLVFQL